jgi:predicted acylesterase/phospholipase RssA
MAEFYREFPIELHFISTEMTQSHVVELSYKTHPEWKLIDALYCSVCLPVFFSPFELDGKVYLDGGVFCNVPTGQCIANGASPDEILTLIACGNPDSLATRNTDVAFGNIIEFMLWLIGKIWRQALNATVPVPHTIYVHMATEYINITEMFEFAKSPEVRQRILDEGIHKWEKFIAKYHLPSSAT